MNSGQCPGRGFVPLLPASVSPSVKQGKRCCPREASGRIAGNVGKRLAPEWAPTLAGVAVAARVSLASRCRPLWVTSTGAQRQRPAPRPHQKQDSNTQRLLAPRAFPMLKRQLSNTGPRPGGGAGRAAVAVVRSSCGNSHPPPGPWTNHRRHSSHSSGPPGGCTSGGLHLPGLRRDGKWLPPGPGTCRRGAWPHTGHSPVAGLGMHFPRLAREETGSGQRRACPGSEILSAAVSLVPGPHMVPWDAAHVDTEALTLISGMERQGKPRHPCRVFPPRGHTPGGYTPEGRTPGRTTCGDVYLEGPHLEDIHLEDAHLGVHIWEQPSTGIPKAVLSSGAPIPSLPGSRGLQGPGPSAYLLASCRVVSSS